MRGTHHPRLPLAYRIAAEMLRPLMLLLTKRDWRGTENFPREGGFVVSTNHVSYFDPLAFAHFMYDSGRPAYFLGKKELFDVPVIGWILRKCGQIPVYRNSTAAASAYQAAVDGIRAGKAVGIFPEGTITRDPELWPMRGKTGAARVALETQCPLIPVAQWGAQQVLSPYAHRPKFFPRSTMTMVAGPPVDLADLYGQPIDSRTLRLATDRLMDAITGLLEQVRGERAPAERFDPRHHGVSEVGNPTTHPEPGPTKAETDSAEERTDGDVS
ncbi:MAG: lysophospholipid acyltransferase family protein [Dermatophilaceae bacterium]